MKQLYYNYWNYNFILTLKAIATIIRIKTKSVIIKIIILNEVNVEMYHNSYKIAQNFIKFYVYVAVQFSLYEPWA
jgi:hypothetical protein